MPDNNNTKFIHSRWRKTKTNSGLPKIVDRNGFAICHGKDYGKEADANFDLIEQSPAMYAVLQDVLGDLISLNEAYDIGKVSGKIKMIESILAAARGETFNQPKG